MDSPLGTLFNQAFQPINNDVVYGLDAPRREYFERYVEYWKEQPDPPPRMSAIFLLLKNVVNPYTGGLRGQAVGIGVGPEMAELIQEYRDDFFIKYERRINATSLDYVNRACKFGASFLAHRNIQVHFVLDGIDMEKVMNKGSSKFDNSPWGGNSTTASELRYIFRNRTALTSGNKPILFYRGGVTVPPPWVGNQFLNWAVYSQYRTKALFSEARAHINWLKKRITVKQGTLFKDLTELDGMVSAYARTDNIVSVTPSLAVTPVAPHQEIVRRPVTPRFAAKCTEPNEYEDIAAMLKSSVLELAVKVGYFLLPQAKNPSHSFT